MEKYPSQMEYTFCFFCLCFITVWRIVRDMSCDSNILCLFFSGSQAVFLLCVCLIWTSLKEFGCSSEIRIGAVLNFLPPSFSFSLLVSFHIFRPLSSLSFSLPRVLSSLSTVPKDYQVSWVSPWMTSWLRFAYCRTEDSSGWVCCLFFFTVSLFLSFLRLLI